MKTKHRYETIVQKGVPHRYKTWVEKFKDEDTEEVVSVKRHMLIKVNGVRVYWHPTKRKIKS